ncbi:MAG: LacI family DNA-binding transcriptional regulator [Pseudomonadota bacterium]
MSDVSIKEVAKLAGVSIATVSRCLNNPGKVREKTRLRVQDAVLKTGYAPNTLAQNFRRGRTQMVMVVLPSVGDPFFTNVMTGVRRVAMAKGFGLLINEIQFNTMNADEIGRLVVSRQADGIILLAGMSTFGKEILSTRGRRDLPIVIGCESVSSDLVDFPGIHIDNVAASKEATDYLISLGHREIGFICGTADSFLTKDREVGYRAAMNQAKIGIEKGWIVPGDLTIEGAVRATRELLNHKRRPSAIFCATDEMAIGCMHEIQAASLKVPEDVSVMGFDDIRYAQVANPPLATVHQPAQQIGEQVMYRLCREIEGDDVGAPQLETLPHRLIIRQSVGPPR